MATAYKVHGPLYIQTGTGTNTALETLGLSLDGADITITRHKREIKSDASGNAPADLQHFNATGRIDIALATWDSAVLTKVLQQAEASTTEGQSGAMGALIGTGSFAHSLYLPSSTDDPWYFPTVTLMEPDRVKSGSEQSIKRLSFFAWRFIPGTALAVGSIKLYQRSAPS